MMPSSNGSAVSNGIKKKKADVIVKYIRPLSANDVFLILSLLLMPSFLICETQSGKLNFETSSNNDKAEPSTSFLPWKNTFAKSSSSDVLIENYYVSAKISKNGRISAHTNELGYPSSSRRSRGRLAKVLK